MTSVIRIGALAMALTVAFFAFVPGLASQSIARQVATPDDPWSCSTVTGQATPGANQFPMDMGTPMSGQMPGMMGMNLDRMYIDMMIPHHASIIALAETALPELTDERLIAIAESIITVQSAEIEKLSGYREDLFGDRRVMPMDGSMMGMMMDMMPGMGSMDDMMFQMDAEAQVLAFCSAVNPDLAFIDQVIPHHEMAIASSEAVVANGTHPEIVTFAERVIADQQAEIDELNDIRDDLATE